MTEKLQPVVVNPPELQKFEIGDSFTVNNEVYRICFLSSLCGVEKTAYDQTFFTIDSYGHVDKVFESIEKMLDHYTDKGILIKVMPIGVTGKNVQYAPVYE